MASFSVVSLIAMVPDNEWRIPTLIISCALAGKTAAIRQRQNPAVAASHRRATGRSATARKE